MPCTHVRTAGDTEENEGDGVAAKERDREETERSVGCTRLSHARAPCRNWRCTCPRSGIPTLPAEKIVPSTFIAMRRFKWTAPDEPSLLAKIMPSRLDEIFLLL